MGDHRKSHYRIHAPSSENGDCEIMKVLLNCFACYEQCDCLKDHNRNYLRRGNQKGRIGNIVYTRRRKTKQKQNTICVRHQYTETNTNPQEITLSNTCTIQWKWRLWDYESVTKLLCMLRAMRLSKRS
jgi:hypothetical protein